MDVKARYSASADDLDKVHCFLPFQETKESSRKMQNLLLISLCLGKHPNQHLKMHEVGRMNVLKIEALDLEQL